MYFGNSKKRAVGCYCSPSVIAKNFSGDFLAEIVQKPYFDTRLNASEGKPAAPCLAAFSISAGSTFVNMVNHVARRARLGNFGP